MAGHRNVLFIMCDQLRFDYLGCAGHPALKTPNIDRLAARGVRFTRAYTQATICGPARMSAYTGRYVRSHGSTQNGVPLRVGEPTLGDHLDGIGARTVLIGKTHMRADRAGMARLGIDPASTIGGRIAECGFEPWERDDGLHPDGPYDPAPRYDDWLRAHGFEAGNPWQDWANSAEGPDGTLLSGWLLAHADKPARIPAAFSETAYMTGRAIDFLREAAAGDRPWCAHLSYIKPHWPYIVPAPYHALYGPGDVPPAVRAEAELQDPHPLFDAFMRERYSRVFTREDVRRRVIPAYMGLIAEIDDQLGRLFAEMDALGLTERTLIVFTSDHGDYLGDHWLGEKYLFHDPSVKVPLIVSDPDPAADAARGTVNDDLVELIDLAPTFLDYLGGTPKPHVLEGRSLLELVRGGRPERWRQVAISEYDYSVDPARRRLDMDVADCRLTMVTDRRWKLVYAEGMRPMLFDLENDPQELVDLGGKAASAAVIDRLERHLFAWARRPASRITADDARMRGDERAAEAFDTNLNAGLPIGYWDEAELERELAARAAFLAPEN